MEQRNDTGNQQATNVQVMTAREQLAEQRLRGATITLARQQAKRRVQAQIKAEGKRVHEYSHKQLMLMADEYLAAHREELMAQARVLAEEIFAKRR
jgi:hypothetical protein